MYEIFSVDDHIIEPANVWTERVSQKYIASAPRVIEEDGKQFWEFEGRRVVSMGLNAVAGKPREQWGLEPTRFDEMIPGCYDPTERARDLLSQGVLASVNFPTLPRFGGMLFNTFADKALALECVKAWNDFVLDEWCPAGPPGLFVPMVIAPVWDPDAAADEIRRCILKGAKALCFVENPVPDGLPSFHHPTHWDPIWQVCSEAGIPICMHVFSSGFSPSIDPEAPWSAMIAAGNIPGMLAMINFLLTGVCERFPEIKVVWSEAGIGWIPAVLERADRQIDRHRYWMDRQLMLRPSELFQRNMWVCMIEEPIGIQLWPWIGAEKILAESDYPHGDTPFPKTQAAYEEVFAGIPEAIIRKISHENAENLFGWKMAAASLADVNTPWQPPHEYRPRFTIDKSEAEGEGCKEFVLSANEYQRCGAEISRVTGRCECGHVQKAS